MPLVQIFRKVLDGHQIQFFNAPTLHLEPTARLHVLDNDIPQAGWGFQSDLAFLIEKSICGNLPRSCPLASSMPSASSLRLWHLLYALGVFSIPMFLLTPWALFFLRPEGPDFLALSFILDSGVPGPLAGGILLDLESSIQG